MSEPKIAAKKPILMELERGPYYWCRCGLSNDQPFCDGSHKGTGFEPLRFDLPERKQVVLCMCKHTQNPPYCDGSHSKLK